MKKRTIIAWAAAAFFLLFGFVYLPSLSSLFAFLGAALLIPQLGAWREKLLQKRWMRIVSVALCVVFMFATVPAAQSTASQTILPTGQEAAADGQAAQSQQTGGEVAEGGALSTDEPSDTAGYDASAGDTVSLTESAAFSITFLDVGQADAALVSCDGKTMLIDGGNVDDSNLIYSFLERKGDSYLDYVVCTHAHEDHVGGLAGALYYAAVGTALAPVTSYDTKAFSDFVKALSQQDKQITVPQAGETFALGSASVQVLGPQKTYDDVNDTSIVLKITYGNTSFLFMGDAGTQSEADILDAGCDVSATVLKVGHHGSSTSTSYRFLRAVMPQYAVISVGTDNAYGHPHEETLSRLRDADATLYRTDLQGDVVCVSDGNTVSFATTKNTAAFTNPTVSVSGETVGAGSDTIAQTDDAQQQTGSETETALPEETVQADETQNNASSQESYYIGNTKSNKFHLPTCKWLPDEENRIFFDTREQAVTAGYEPCQKCNP